MSTVDNVKVTQETITPEYAKEILSRNTNNRNLRSRHVDSLARDMAAGYWQNNGETIKIDPHGTVVDGQHRLSAVIRSGVSVPMLVVRDVDMQAQATVDTGAKRSFSDHLKLNGETNTTVLAAAVRALYLYNTGRGYSLRSSIMPTTPELMRVLEENPNIRNSVKVASRKGTGLEFSKSVIAFTHYILSNIDEEDAEYFFEHAISGIDLSEDSPIYRLRQVSADKMRNNPSAGMWVFAIPVIFKAWNKFRDGQVCVSLGYRRGGASPEKFPMPH